MNLKELGEFILKIIDAIKGWFTNLFQDAVDTDSQPDNDITGDDIVDYIPTTV